MDATEKYSDPSERANEPADPDFKAKALTLSAQKRWPADRPALAKAPFSCMRLSAKCPF